MWQEILKQKADFAGFFRDFEKNKIAELAKDDGEGWLNIIPIAKKYGLSDSAIHFIFKTNNPSFRKEQPDRFPIPAVDISSYNKAIKKDIEHNQRLKMKRQKETYKPRRKGQRKKGRR